MNHSYTWSANMKQIQKDNITQTKQNKLNKT